MFTARYALSPSITQLGLVLKGIRSAVLVLRRSVIDELPLER